VAVSNVTISDSQTMGSLVNVVLQTMLERGAIAREGELGLSIDGLKSASLKREMIASYKKGATGVTTVRLAVATPHEGDAENRLFEIEFPGPADSLQIRHDQLLSKLFGAEDTPVMVQEGDPELLAASARAKRALLKLKPRFSPRQPALEHLLVKAPFQTEAGEVEWMWIEVVRWQGKKIEGILKSDPLVVQGLKAGERVEAEEASIFDYILKGPDGKTEGNETGRILQKRGR
jgi:uncharacterized protein YegJ (DUF2314 family)